MPKAVEIVEITQNASISMAVAYAIEKRAESRNALADPCILVEGNALSASFACSVLESELSTHRYASILLVGESFVAYEEKN
jgi:hypothetical protein